MTSDTGTDAQVLRKHFVLARLRISGASKNQSNLYLHGTFLTSGSTKCLTEGKNEQRDIQDKQSSALTSLFS